jgi:Mg-chelatase subunit ChlD
LILVLDKSASMTEGNKIDLLKETVQFIIKMLTERDRLSIVTFNDQAQRLNPLQRLTPESKESIKNQIEEVKAVGETNIAQGMDIAFAILDQRRHKNPVTCILLLSDGHDPNADKRTENLMG